MFQWATMSSSSNNIFWRKKSNLILDQKLKVVLMVFFPLMKNEPRVERNLYELIFFAADCTWDFFACTNNYGTWPNNKICCEERFEQCCEKVNGKKKVPKPVAPKPEPPTSISSSSGNGLRLSKIFIRCFMALNLAN